MKYKAIIFDFDLTLADSSQGILICFRHTLSAFGYSVPKDSIIYSTIGLTLVDAFDLLTGIPHNPEREQMRKEYVKKADEEMVKNTFFYDGVISALKRLRNDGIKVGVCSTKYRYRIEDSFKHQAGCMPVDLIIGGEDVPEDSAKPNPIGLISCIEKLNVKKNEVLYVGDSYIDAETALNAGVNFGAVLTGSTEIDTFKNYPYSFIADNTAELITNVYNQ